MATITGATIDQASSDLRLTPEKYTTIDNLIKTTKDFVMPDLVESYGDQGITGFLNLVGAVNSGGTSDQVDWWEAGRRHRIIGGALASSAAGGTANSPGTAVFTVDDTLSGDATDSSIGLVQANDVLMNAETGTRYLVNEAPASADAGLKLERLDGVNDSPAEDGTTTKMIHLGNIYAQGSNQPTHFTDADAVKYSNPFMIVKG
jgi:hypothetical protein